MREYCDGEEFSASCASGATVNVTSAFYGRMQLGRCVCKDLGYVGCSEDVTETLNSRCTGQQLCEISIPDAGLENTSPCISEIDQVPLGQLYVRVIEQQVNWHHALWHSVSMEIYWGTHPVSDNVGRFHTFHNNFLYSFIYRWSIHSPSCAWKDLFYARKVSK